VEIREKRRLYQNLGEQAFIECILAGFVHFAGIVFKGQKSHMGQKKGGGYRIL